MKNIHPERIGKRSVRWCNLIAMKSYEIIIKVDDTICRKVVDAATQAKAKSQIKESYPSQKIEFISVKQVV